MGPIDWPRRHSDLFVLFCLAGALLLGLAMVHSRLGEQAHEPTLAITARVVADLGLTDLCLSTEARHTRHPSQADRSTAFQSHPLALDHFPSGSFIGPPPALRSGS
jgi:hypothetical protein